MRFFFFFFKQKTAYEMRISDWSPDVCSSDLADRRRDRPSWSALLPVDGGAYAVEAEPVTALVTATGLAIAGRLEATRLSLEAGTLTCLVGPNGGGKTSLLHALAGIGHPSGTVRIDGMDARSEEHTSELQSLMRISYAVFCLKKKKNHINNN